MMNNNNIGAIVILDEASKLVGIVTERDLTRRAIAKDLDPKKTLIEKIMTKNPDTLAPGDSASDALELMQSRHYRHLPVVDKEICVGMVSIRDLYIAAKSSLEKNIRETEAFIFGDRYGA
jgi:CBS domain-containing protein